MSVAAPDRRTASPSRPRWPSVASSSSSSTVAIVSPERIEGIDLPTLIEQGYDVSMTNWRGFLAPAGITDEEFAELEAIVTETAQSPEWQEAMERNRWTDVFLTGPELVDFIEEDTRQNEALIEELGL